MSNNTKPKTSNKRPKKTNTGSGKKPVSTSHISLPGDREIKMNFVSWTILITLIGLLILVLVTQPNRSIKNHIKSLESKDEIVAYCTEKDLNCTFTVLSDYDIEGYKVARVSFLADDFFGTTEAPEATSGSEQSSADSQRNVYITVQKGETIEVPE